MSSLFLQGKVSICNNYGQTKTNLNELPDGFIQYPQVILTKLLVGGSGSERKKNNFFYLPYHHPLLPCGLERPLHPPRPPQSLPPLVGKPPAPAGTTLDSSRTRLGSGVSLATSPVSSAPLTPANIPDSPAASLTYCSQRR